LSFPDPILQAFARLVRRAPLAPLVITPERRATVEDVAALARAAGRRLADARLAPGAIVGLAAANGPGFLAALLALRQAGLAALLLDAQTPATEARRVLAALGASALLRAPGWPAGPDDWTLQVAAVTGEDDTPVPSPPPLLPAGTAVVKLTSGSTGAPRGIAATAEALLADDAALTRTMGLSAGDRLLTAIPLSHSYGLSSLALPALVRGAVLALPDAAEGYDPILTAERTGATFFPTVPAYLDALVRRGDPPRLPAPLRLVTTAGAPLSAATSARFRELFALPVHVFYGSSECGGICYDREGGAAERGTVGAPVEGVTITLEPVDGPPCPESGRRVVVESPAVSSGYLPAISGDADDRLRDGRFLAGDLALWRHGELALAGRVDDLINIKGKKVNPREVEGILAALAGVDEASVLGLAVPGRGELLRAVIACRPGSLTAEAVVAWCREHLSAHKVPRSVILVEALPRNSRGKLDRRALLELGNGRP
jgi:long-chain acyl-CoA synthetase